MLNERLPVAPAKGGDAALFLQSLRSTTAPQHTLLETQEVTTTLMSEQVTLQDYYNYLVLMQKVQFAYEESVLPVLAARCPEITIKKASKPLEEDIESIKNDELHKWKSLDFVLPKKDMSIAFMLGITYVLEGSKLGGKVINKHLQRLLGVTEAQGAKYISDFGADTGSSWKKFLTTFSTYVTENNVEAEAMDGAKATFSAIYDYFEANRSNYAV